MRECEATGKNIEQAIQNALLELKASREDVDIKILNQGGFLKKAKVLVSISEDALDKYERKEELKAQLVKEETEENDEDFAEKFVKNKIKATEEKSQEAPTKPARETKIVADEEYVKPEAKQDPAEEVGEEKKERPAREKIQRKFTPEEFINGVLDSLGAEGTLEKEDNDVVDSYCLKGENLNDLIGHHGDCMNALSYIMSLVVKNESGKRIVLDIENYRDKREEALKALAKRTADKVAKTKRYFKFEPMPASERRILHLALQDDDRVTTMSKGTEPHRYLMVFPKDYEERY